MDVVKKRHIQLGRGDLDRLLDDEREFDSKFSLISEEVCRQYYDVGREYAMNLYFVAIGILAERRR